MFGGFSAWGWWVFRIWGEGFNASSPGLQTSGCRDSGSRLAAIPRFFQVRRGFTEAYKIL